MERITIQQASEAVIELFDCLPFEKKEDGKSFYVNKDDRTSFYLDKRQHPRYEVEDKLIEHFTNRVIEGGQCRIEPITILWTVVHIEKRGAHKMDHGRENTN